MLQKECNIAILLWQNKIVFALLTKNVTNHGIVTPINVKKACLKRTVLRAICRCMFDFDHYLDNVLYFFVWIKLWPGSRACNSSYQYIVGTSEGSLRAGKLVWAYKGGQWPRWKRGSRFRDMTLNSIRAFRSSKSYWKMDMLWRTLKV